MNYYQPCQFESFATIYRFSYLTNHAGLLSTVPRLPFHLLYDYQPTFITMKRPIIIYRIGIAQYVYNVTVEYITPPQ